MDVILPLKRYLKKIICQLQGLSTTLEHKSIKSFCSPSLAGGIVGGGSVVGGSVGA